MRGIDIASYQKGIDLSQVPCDFVIVKATEGTGYVNPDCARAVEQALKLGKAVGVYHYVNGAGATAEAEYFYSQCKGWNGKVVWCVDWESGGNRAWGNTTYLDTLIKRLRTLTGRPPMLYASSSAFPWTIAKNNDCGTWVAQYASNAATDYQDTPWNEAAYSCTIRQYSSTGRLTGWNGNLDLNKFYGNRDAWNKYAGTSTATATVAKASTATATVKTAAAKTTAGTLDVTAIQKAVHVTADNIVGTQTRTAVSLVAQASRWGGTKFPNGVAATQRAVGATPDGIWGPASKAAHDNTVKAIQTALNALGYKLDVDGIWGPATEKAVTDALTKGHQA
ncbi:GH25 family lysozyme [Actinomyces sp. MRS3W]|uniref:GH25 family lysozyme n=1 Tax=Actinomyces sp. MRS3W TaxID=2800796 RepID=UPI0028FD32EB|nr:GH25 family lysozyme [Actinomyces sp. MRS3W]MDU0347487.1 GH25 family lysozyme [Actinomyces sp. MRS3W]